MSAEGDSQKLERNTFQKDSEKLKRNESPTSDQVPEGSNNAAEGDPRFHFIFIFIHFILKYLYRYKFHIFIHVFQTDLLKNNIK